MTLLRLGGIRIAAADPAALAGFYCELGLLHDGDGGFAATDGGTQVTVEEGPCRRLLGVEVATSDAADLGAISSRLDGLGLASTRRDGGLTAVDPATLVAFTVRPGAAAPAPASTTPAVVDNRPGAIVRRNRRAPGVFGSPRPPRRLGHVVIGTPDPEATRRFLVDGLGFKVSDEVAGIISFLRCSTDHHNVALVHSPVPILQHYSWECDDIDHVGHTATALLRADAERQVWGFGRHFVGSNHYWYLRDPAGSFVELYADMDVIDDDDEWERAGRTPVGFEHVANSWGPDIPAEFIVPADLDELQRHWDGSAWR